MLKFWIALAAAVLLFSAGPVFADGIIDTFTGVVASDSTLDSGGYFGGGNLAGDKFTLTMTLDPTIVSGMTFVTSGVTGTLAINGHTQVLDAAGFGFLVSGGATEIVLEAFSLGGQAVGVDLNANVPIVQDLGVAFPTMSLNNGDFSQNAANFTDSVSENLDLTVQAVNPVPEPSTWALMIGGLVALALIARKSAA